LGQENGLDFLREVRREEPGIPVIIITGHGDIGSAVECMKAGATNYILKPVDSGLLFSVLEKERLALGDRLTSDAFRESLRAAVRRRLVPSSTREMKEIERVVEKVKDSDIPVLLLGETGTGKEVIARTIHYSGSYRDRPFVALNCASLSESLLESELFGHEKGAFTGAVSRTVGRFELAGNGTLFLDEIGDMSLAMQAKLLRVLQERTLERVGGTRPVTVYCRLIAATNKDIADLRARGVFRDDLYYRLSTVTMRLPPLRERGADIPALVQLFIDEANASYGRAVRCVAEPVMRRLCTHPWPGNIRQLKNVITNAVIMAEGEEISWLDPGEGEQQSASGEPVPAEGEDLHAAVSRATRDMERKIIASALSTAGGNVSRAATRLGISRKTLYEKMRRHNL
ncbi:MAG TPA: sigma-54 dependent transcriptional regulator, partial [bacterium]|nr:sigma-54 dependent transcriptional regulator [bacterium]